MKVVAEPGRGSRVQNDCVVAGEDAVIEFFPWPWGRRQRLVAAFREFVMKLLVSSRIKVTGRRFARLPEEKKAEAVVEEIPTMMVLASEVVRQCSIQLFHNRTSSPRSHPRDINCPSHTSQ